MCETPTYETYYLVGFFGIGHCISNVNMLSIITPRSFISMTSNALFRLPYLWPTVAKNDKVKYKQLSFSQPKRSKRRNIAKAKYFSGKPVT